MTEVLSWNVLAPAYALPGRYAGVPADHLAAATRVPRLRDQLAGLLPNVDVLALQEVDADLAGWLRGLPGAAVAYRQRPRSPDGVALVSERHPLEAPTGGTSTDGRRVWAAATVTGIRVLSAHLDWAPANAEPHRGGIQASELLAWADQDPATSGLPLVVAGDLNAAWDSAPGAALAAGGLVPLGDPVRATAVVDGRAVDLDGVAARGATGTLTVLRELPAPGAAFTLPDATTPSDHAPICAVLHPV